MAALEIRFARESDLAAITEIYNYEVLNGTATFETQPRSVEEIRDWLLGPTQPRLALVALSEEKVVGFGGLYPWSPRTGYALTAENTVYCHPDHRGLGIGSQLLSAVVNEGRKAKLHTLIARIASGNEASTRLHKSLGFKSIGTMKEVGKKFGQFRDVDLLQLMY